ncbi:MAG TPA: NUDIX hydrolase [Xanthobacteraceae bacterium]|jgi:hypothetical protein|nr:NUDIX hydrolase [Xanthobacteraceae bacterium]
MASISITPVQRLDLHFAPKQWPFAQARRAEIDAHFKSMQQQQSAMWNGRVLLLYESALSDGEFSGSFLETDFASFVAHRDWNFPDPQVRNCFGAGVLRAADGAFLLGVMGAHTANAGKIYFPCGTPDPRDLVEDRVDFHGSILRELAEETGLTSADFKIAPGWHVVFEGQRTAVLKVLQAKQSASEIRDRILGFIASEHQPELADVRIIRGPSDFDPMMPNFVPAFLRYLWRRGD